MLAVISGTDVTVVGGLVITGQVFEILACTWSWPSIHCNCELLWGFIVSWLLVLCSCFLGMPAPLLSRLIWDVCLSLIVPCLHARRGAARFVQLLAPYHYSDAAALSTCNPRLPPFSAATFAYHETLSCSLIFSAPACHLQGFKAGMQRASCPVLCSMEQRLCRLFGSGFAVKWMLPL